MAYGYDELADAFADTHSFTDGTPARRRRTMGAGLRAYGRGVRERQSRRGQRWGRGEHGTCRGCGRELGGRWGGAAVVLPLSPTRTLGSRVADEFNEVNLAAPSPPSPWPRLLRQAQAAIGRALEVYLAGNRQAMTNAIWHAKSLLQQAHREVSRVMPEPRATQTTDGIVLASYNLDLARAAATGADAYRHLLDAFRAVRSAVRGVVGPVLESTYPNPAEFLRTALSNISTENHEAAAQYLRMAASIISDPSLWRLIIHAINRVNQRNWGISRHLTETVLRRIQPSSSRPGVRR